MKVVLEKGGGGEAKIDYHYEVGDNIVTIMIIVYSPVRVCNDWSYAQCKNYARGVRVES